MGLKQEEADEEGVEGLDLEWYWILEVSVDKNEWLVV